jgi:flagellar motor protein MotB
MPSSAGKYLCKDQITKKQARKICEEVGLRKVLWDRGPLQPIYNKVCDNRGRISRLQLVWGCSSFDIDGTPKGPLANQLEALRDAARIAKVAADAAHAAAAGAEVDIIIACHTNLRQKLTLVGFIEKLAKHVKRRRLRASFWRINQEIVPGVLGFCDSLDHRLAEIQAEIDVLWKQEGMRLLQSQISEEISDSCPHIKPDMLNNQIRILEPLNFEGGEATVLMEDLPILHEICHVVGAMLGVIDSVNDALEEKGGLRVLQVPHLRIEGHVQKTKKSTPEKMLRISQERAQTVVDEVKKCGCPARLLHPQGLGASCPIGSAEENRRVEIHLMMSDELDTFIQTKFREHDADGSGVLSPKEVHRLALELGMDHQEIQAQLEQFDSADGAEDGISLAELQSWLRYSKIM